MKINWLHIKLVVSILFFIGLYSFSNFRNSDSEIKDIDTNYQKINEVYVTPNEVKKLLIQNQKTVKNLDKEELDLKSLENLLQQNEFIKNANVYLSISDTLKVEIQQRNPIVRVQDKIDYYLDDFGDKMPLSKHNTKRVPLITGKISKENYLDIVKVSKIINEDDLMKKFVVGYQLNNNNEYMLRTRSLPFSIKIGTSKNLKFKIKKFKAFYKKAKKNKKLNDYVLVSLNYKNQVVCTKL